MFVKKRDLKKFIWTSYQKVGGKAIKRAKVNR